MEDEKIKCTYHPNRDAASKCYKCGKLICLECEAPIKNASYNSHLCKLCLYDSEINQNSNNKGFLIGIILIVIVGSFPLILNFTLFRDPFFKWVRLWMYLMLICPLTMIYFMIKGSQTMPSKLNAAKKNKEEFLAKIQNNLPLSEDTKIVYDDEYAICPHCKEKIDKNAIICSFCGESRT